LSTYERDVAQDLKDKGGEDWKTFNNNFGKYLKVSAPPYMCIYVYIYTYYIYR